MTDLLDLAELREAIRSVLADRNGGAIAIPGDEGRGLDRALWDEMAALGWLGLAIPEHAGGIGQTAAHLGVLYEELGRELASVPIASTMLIAAAITAHGDAATQAKWLPAIAAGEVLGAIALREAGTADGPANDTQTLSGTFDHVLFADVATLLAVPAETGGLALIAADTPGVSIAGRPVVDLTRSMARITLDHATPEAILPLTPADWDRLLDHAAIALACDAVGAAAALLDRTVEYLKVREQFGRPIGSFQALKHRAADWMVKIEATTVLARHAAALLGSQPDTPSAPLSIGASEAKFYACDVFAAFAGDAVQLHGGIGFTWEHPCHLFLKRAKLSQQLYGSASLHKDRAARFAFANPATGA